LHRKVLDYPLLEEAWLRRPGLLSSGEAVRWTSSLNE